MSGCTWNCRLDLCRRRQAQPGQPNIEVKGVEQSTVQRRGSLTEHPVNNTGHPHCVQWCISICPKHSCIPISTSEWNNPQGHERIKRTFQQPLSNCPLPKTHPMLPTPYIHTCRVNMHQQQTHLHRSVTHSPQPVAKQPFSFHSPRRQPGQSQSLSSSSAWQGWRWGCLRCHYWGCRLPAQSSSLSSLQAEGQGRRRRGRSRRLS